MNKTEMKMEKPNELRKVSAISERELNDEREDTLKKGRRCLVRQTIQQNRLAISSEFIAVGNVLNSGLCKEQSALQRLGMCHESWQRGKA